MRQKRRQAGFSLLEVIVVITIIGVVTGIGSVMFFTMMDVWNGLKTQVDLDRNAEQALDSMAQDFAAAVSPKLAGQALTGTDGTIENALFRRIPLANDAVEFPILASSQRIDGVVGRGLGT